jgi:hypothetical protein
LLRKIVLALGWSEGFDSKAKSVRGREEEMIIYFRREVDGF